MMVYLDPVYVRFIGQDCMSEFTARVPFRVCAIVVASGE